ncbi:hypothetical protein DL766_005871 [Monosporascus sp. MC13-8B]|uniref:NmrA-like domain-containing protein n=1 Tax=Monosporascus cannonballus TaxID=155416 RepID=A0ABY0HAB7_9PEZI|nr:hypothetical protein DL762_005139 [Monosporascus cannonballus]RYO91496.1 hypothetical protein DL763_004960 [Monosporascus cannonballus]RYP28440.1 hypothetical protein DL766_005871 [Monosporascus sp. MC13-8B]
MVSTETEKVEKYFRENGLLLPSFGVRSLDNISLLPDHISKNRFEVIKATQELKSLIVEPRETVRWMAWDFMNTQSLQLVNHFRIGTLLLYSTFLQPAPGVIAHTSAFRPPIEEQDLQAWIGFNTEDLCPASARVIYALEQYPEATNLMCTGFNFAFDTVDEEPMFATPGKDAKQEKRMG